MSDFWRGKKVFLTGHTGFKGAWLTLLLNHWGAKVYGYALPAEEMSLFRMLNLSRLIEGERLADIGDHAALQAFYIAAAPDVTIHMAAQALVLPSYANPVETFRVNALGTATLLDVIRLAKLPQTVIIVTTDKVYENLETGRSYGETDRLGGSDPYSASKACAEIVAQSFRRSFCGDPRDGVVVKTARAGNVIGAGDWSAHRLVPDLMRAISLGRDLVIRHPESVRPWQHVLEPLAGYVRLAERTVTDPCMVCDDSFNFGPSRESCWPTGKIVARLTELWGQNVERREKGREENVPHEAKLLHLDSSRARDVLEWTPRWDIERTLSATVAGYKAVTELAPDAACAALVGQIEDYFQNS